MEIVSCNIYIICTISFQVSFSPYIFECFTYAPVHDQDSAVQIGNGVVLFKLQKHEPALWGQLQHPDKGECISYNISNVLNGHMFTN